MQKPRTLTIAGSDSGGGAGIQADLKTFTVLNTYGMSVLTALTAQNTVGVHGIHPVPAPFVAAQLNAVLDDIGADSVKTGMLMNAEVVTTVSECLLAHKVQNLVVDPVMVAKSGDRLLLPDAVEAVREQLIPLAAIVTPNTEEAAILAGMDEVGTPDDMKRAAERIVALGARSVLVKGGHLGGVTSDDLWFDGDAFHTLPAPRQNNRHTHGTGCTLSAALAALLGHGIAPLEAVQGAKYFISGAIAAAYPIGHGIGPVNHLWQRGETNG
jgi:hydroxymethylpyrimidine/phosphomethylpyrimidine kinase